MLKGEGKCVDIKSYNTVVNILLFTDNDILLFVLYGNEGWIPGTKNMYSCDSCSKNV